MLCTVVLITDRRLISGGHDMHIAENAPTTPPPPPEGGILDLVLPVHFIQEPLVSLLVMLKCSMRQPLKVAGTSFLARGARHSCVTRER